MSKITVVYDGRQVQVDADKWAESTYLTLYKGATAVACFKNWQAVFKDIECPPRQTLRENI